MGEIARLEFDDLKDNMFYEVYITVASILDYEYPPMLYDDT